MNFLKLCLCLQVLAFSAQSLADIHLPKLISNGAVLQRDEVLSLVGFATESQRVGVFLNNKELASTQSAQGKWKVELPPQPAGGPHILSFKGKNTISLSDIYFGDVWIAAGQSNMETTLGRVQYQYPDEINNLHNALIRQFKPPREYDFRTARQDYPQGAWQTPSKQNIDDFSAIAYFFAKHIQADQNIPIGVISIAKGGSAAEGWLSEEALQAFPKYIDVVKSLRQKGHPETLIEQDRKDSAAWFAKMNRADKGMSKRNAWYDPDYNDSQWAKVLIPGQFSQVRNVKGEPDGSRGSHWLRRQIRLPSSQSLRQAQLWLGRIVDADTVYVNGQEIGTTSYMYPPRIYNIPDGLLKKGQNTIAVRVVDVSGNGGFVRDKPYALKLDGMEIDLTGEWKYHRGAKMKRAKAARFSEFHQPLGYRNAMLAPLSNTQVKGVLWYQGESNVGRDQEYALLMRALIKDWRKLFNKPNLPFLYVQLASFLEEQAELSESSWAALREQQRLLQSVDNTAMAVALDVGEWNDVHPLRKKPLGDRLALAARKMVYGDNDIVFSGPKIRCFSFFANEITLQFDAVGNGLSSKGVPLRGFIAAGSDGKFKHCKASIVDNTVVLKQCGIDSPQTIRYAWADNPGSGLLFNAEGLPASSFSLSKQCRQTP